VFGGERGEGGYDECDILTQGNSNTRWGGRCGRERREKSESFCEGDSYTRPLIYEEYSKRKKGKTDKGGRKKPQVDSPSL